MIFASDLDQTLIYSTKFLGEYHYFVKPIELYEGREISFVSCKSFDLLKKINEQHMFIPVTTRTVEQYQRISLFHNDIQPQYAVMSNGGVIMHNGEIVKSWKKIIEKRIQNESASYKEINGRFKQIFGDDTWILSLKMAEDLFFYYIIDRDKLPLQKIEEFGNWVEERNWSMSIQGRKLYLVPNGINKGDAIQFIAERENEEMIIAAGDSLLDLPLLLIADIAIAPNHGELYRQSSKIRTVKRVIFTKSNGMLASEEILNYVLKERLVK
ncbi:HAD hydrolase family protein [Brevibacillus sp. GCM10020057]|uniref:HAD hydrolase family protein n=1 Tax=Brevibacillus sp. GCM10020057 TaxID=3317327 RepID=UPI00362D48D4